MQAAAGWMPQPSICRGSVLLGQGKALPEGTGVVPEGMEGVPLGTVQPPSSSLLERVQPCGMGSSRDNSDSLKRVTRAAPWLWCEQHHAGGRGSNTPTGTIPKSFLLPSPSSQQQHHTRLGGISPAQSWVMGSLCCPQPPSEQGMLRLRCQQAPQMLPAALWMLLARAHVGKVQIPLPLEVTLPWEEAALAWSWCCRCWKAKP